MKYFLPIITIFLLFSCKMEEDNFQINLDEGIEYFPLEVGKYVIYEMDSTIYDPNGMEMVRQSITQLKEVIVDTLRDNNDNFLYKVEQFTRLGDTLPWTIQNVYTTAIIDNQAQRTEENLKFIKMTFPIRDNRSWDGNIFFDEGTIVIVAGETIEMFKGWDYRIKEVDLIDTIGNQVFEPVLLIEQADEDGIYELRQSFEKYAPNVGLIYREVRILDGQESLIACNAACDAERAARCTTKCEEMGMEGNELDECIEKCINDCIACSTDCPNECNKECYDACDELTWEEKAEKGFILKQKILDYN